MTLRQWVDTLNALPLERVIELAYGPGDHSHRVRQLAMLRSAAMRWPEDAQLHGSWVLEALAAARDNR